MLETSDGIKKYFSGLYFFSATALCFYRGDDFHEYKKAGSWPDDAIEVDFAIFKEFATSLPPKNKVLSVNNSGTPAWSDIPPPKPDELSLAVRAQRDTLIDRVSREIERRQDAGEDVTAWRVHRQFLRDIPDQSGFPKDIDWGVQPAEFTGK